MNSKLTSALLAATLVAVSPLLAGEVYLGQNFNNFPTNGIGNYGSAADSQGLWGAFSDKESSPRVQTEKVRRAADKDAKNERSICITRDDQETATTSTWLIGQREAPLHCKKAALTFWILRTSPESGFSVHLCSTEKHFSSTIALLFGNTSQFAQRVCYQNESSGWVESSHTVKPTEWERFKIVIDFKKNTYSLYAGDKEQETVAQDIPWKTKLPINAIIFAPTVPDKNTFCIDDVEIIVLE